MEYYTLNNAVGIPCLGLGVWQAYGDEAYRAVLMAAELGYRLIDTAAYYENEADIGRAIRDCGVARGELFITSKVWPSQMTEQLARESFFRSLEKLGLDYLDMFLLHWPIGDVAGSWRALEALHGEGLIRAIGVSNFMPAHLDELFKTAKIKPAVNQLESNPYFVQAGAVDAAKARSVAVEVWGPLGKGAVLKDPAITALSAKYKKTPAQIVLRWHYQRGVIAIPKSVRRERLSENLDIFSFELEQKDMETVASLDKGSTDRYYPAEFDTGRFGQIAPEGMAER